MPQRAPLLPAREHRLGLAELGMLDRRRTLWGLGLAVVLPIVVEAIVVATGYHNVAMTMLIQLAAAVVVAVVGGLWPAAIAAVVGALLLNYFSVEPIGSFQIADPQVVGELVIFLAVACAVGLAVGAATRRYEQ